MKSHADCCLQDFHYRLTFILIIQKDHVSTCLFSKFNEIKTPNRSCCSPVFLLPLHFSHNVQQVLVAVYFMVNHVFA